MPTDPANAAALDAHSRAAAEHHAAAHYHHEAMLSHEGGDHEDAKALSEAAIRRAEMAHAKAREAHEHTIKLK